MKELWNRYHAHGPGDASENELIHIYLHLVQTVVGRLAMHLPSQVSKEDLHSAGLVGLLNAVRHFKPSLGASFESYARIRIRGSALDELRRMDWVPRSVHTKARKVQSIMSDLENKLSRLPTEIEMATALNISPQQYEKLLDEIRPATFICLDACSPNQNGDGPLEHEAIAGDSGDDTPDQVSRRELAGLIYDCIRTMPKMHQKVLALYYFEDLRLREIAELCGLCESRICQIHSQAILAVRGQIEAMEQRNQSRPGDNSRLAA
jgi:RNA polymerase sigma factor for flagellar operon FliA